MKKSLFLGALLFAVPSFAQQAKIEALGVSTGKKLTQAQKDVFLFTNEGTRLQLGISIPGRVFIGEDREQCKFGKFTDDKGTDLFAPLGHAPEADDWLGSFGPKFTSDGKLCGLQVEAPGLPAKDATKLQLSAKMVLRCGTSPKTIEQKSVSLKQGAKITVGPVPLQITKAAADGIDTKIDIKANKPVDRIFRISFFDAKGKEIPSHLDGYESGGFLGNYSVTQYFVLSGKRTAANVKVSYYEKVENVTVPVEIEAGLGL
jgi:hypothetical protein